MLLDMINGSHRKRYGDGFNTENPPTLRVNPA